MKIKKIIKDIILCAGYYSGAFEMMRLDSNRRDLVPILVYHRVLDEPRRQKVSSAFRLKGLVVSKINFEKQIKYLGRKYHLLTLPEYIKRKKTGEALGGCAVITFDDGFKDFYTIAWEILKQYQAPATVFIGPWLFEQVYWQHQVYLILDNSSNDKVDLNWGKEKITINLTNDQEKYQTINRLIASLRKKDHIQRMHLIEQLAQALEVKNKPFPQEIYLSNSELKQLVAGGVSLGAHSVTHSYMTDLIPEQRRQEIEGSLNFVKNITQEEQVSFALPFGDGSPETLAEIKARGCLCNFARDAGLNSPEEDIFQLKRVAALDFALPEFAFNISGAGMLFAKFWKGQR